MKRKLKLGISACLLGEKVRYDGRHKLDQWLIDTLSPLVEWVPVCPEVEAGLPAPREPMQLVETGQIVRLITIETKQDRTEILTRWTGGKLQQLDLEGIRGFVFKARSPSCGIHDSELFSTSGESVRRRSGLFAEALMSSFPSLPVEDEKTLRDKAVRETFLARILV